MAVKTEQSVEETADEFTTFIAAEVADQEKVQEVEIDEKKQKSEEIAAAEVDKVAEETRLKLIKSEGRGGQS